MTLAMKVPEGKMIQRTYLLGVSEDRKKTWTFVDTAQADVTKLKILFPDLPEALKIPPRENPYSNTISIVSRYNKQAHKNFTPSDSFGLRNFRIGAKLEVANVTYTLNINAYH